MSKKKVVIVTLDDQHVRDIRQVADKCRAAGMLVQDSLEFLGQITGEIDPEKESALSQIPGVLSVDASEEYQLPPPDSEVQ